MHEDQQNPKIRIIKLAVCFLVPILILMSPVPQGLSKLAWQTLAVYMGAIFGIMLRPLPEPVVLIISMAALSIFFKGIHVALGAFAEATPWMIFTAFIIGQCFVETGLGARIAYFLIEKFGKNTLRLGYISTLTDLILAPAIPSNTARTGGLVYPIFRGLAETLDSRPGETARRAGSYFMILLYQNSLQTGSMFVTAGAIMPVLLKLTKDLMGGEIDWIQWAAAMSLPGLLGLLIIPYVVYKIYPPEIKEVCKTSLTKEGKEKLGAMSVREKLLAFIFVGGIVCWSTASITKLDTTAVALTMLALCLLTGVISWEKVLKNGSAWSTFLWYAGIMSIANGLNKAGFFKWLGKWFEMNIHFAGMNQTFVLVGLILLTIVVRYVFASTIAFVVTFIPVIFVMGAAAKLPAIPLLLLCAASAQIASLLTHYGNACGPVLFGAGYVDQVTWWKIGHISVVICMSIYFLIGLPWWKILGLW